MYFLADHRRSTDLAIELAETELRFRNDPQAHDAYAWALYSTGRLAEARAASDLSMVGGFLSAPTLFHTGMISAGLGDTVRAVDELTRALALNDRFDPVQAGVAQNLLLSPGG